MKHISEMDTQEMRFSLENMHLQIIPVWEIDSRKYIPPGDAVYIFLKYHSPHSIYIGISQWVRSRILQHRRLRATYGSVLIFSIAGYLDIKILEEIEERLLRLAWKRWPWASWSNERGLSVKGPDRYACQGNPDLMALVEKILRETEAHISSFKSFDLSPNKSLPVTQQIGSPSSKIFAMGSSSRRGITVLKGSRLPKFVKLLSDLKKVSTHPAILALEYYHVGLLSRRSWCLDRCEGIYFTHDTLFTDWDIAASIVSLEERPRTDWKPVKKLKRDVVK